MQASRIISRLQVKGAIAESAGSADADKLVKLDATGKIDNDTLATSVLTVGVLDTDTTLAANSDLKVATQKATKAYADTKIASGYLDTDTTLAANSDTKLASQKATKTYADTKVPLTYLDADTTLAANSDIKVATQKAIKAYVDASVTGLLDFKGTFSGSGNPNYPAGLKGDTYVCSVAGKIGGASGKPIAVGDFIICTATSAVTGNEASVGTSWSILEANITATGSAGLAMLAATTAAEQTALLDNFTSSLKGLVPASGGGTTNYLRADGNWAAAGGAVTIPRVIHVMTSGNDTTGNGSVTAPYLTAQKAFDIAYAASGSQVISLGVTTTHFGQVVIPFGQEWPERIALHGMSTNGSVIQVVTSSSGCGINIVGNHAVTILAVHSVGADGDLLGSFGNPGGDGGDITLTALTHGDVLAVGGTGGTGEQGEDAPPESLAVGGDGFAGGNGGDYGRIILNNTIALEGAAITSKTGSGGSGGAGGMGDGGSNNGAQGANGDGDMPGLVYFDGCDVRGVSEVTGQTTGGRTSFNNNTMSITNDLGGNAVYSL